MNIYELFADATQHAAAHPALVAGIGNKRRSMSFEELDRKVGGIVATLRKSGLRAGDKVLLAVPISIDTYVVMLALLKAGMVIMHIDPAHGSSQVSRILKAWPPAAIVASKPILMLGMLFPELRRIPKRFVVGGRARGATTLCTAEAPQTSQAVIERFSADSAILSFTSGSTGEPKPLIRTHGFLLKQMEILKRVAELEPDDIDFVAMPMFVLFNLANRITSVLPACNMKHPGRADPRIVLSQLLHRRLAGFARTTGRSLPGSQTDDSRHALHFNGRRTGGANPAAAAAHLSPERRYQDGIWQYRGRANCQYRCARGVARRPRKNS
jgi:acyl-coenzyme A synthetase/AMP-(fatty) acid ligase